MIEELKQRTSAKPHKSSDTMAKFRITSRTDYLRLIRGVFTKNLMIHKKKTNRFLTLMKLERFGVIFGTGQWNTEEMLVG